MMMMLIILILIRLMALSYTSMQIKVRAFNSNEKDWKMTSKMPFEDEYENKPSRQKSIENSVSGRRESFLPNCMESCGILTLPAHTVIDSIAWTK
jgi:hypothetical protein